MKGGVKQYAEERNGDAADVEVERLHIRCGVGYSFCDCKPGAMACWRGRLTAFGIEQ